jgi:F-type H+-transporting ATPase subunit b
VQGTGIGMISINATLIVQIINLLVLIWILNRLMYRPIKRIAAERQAKVEEGLQQAVQMADASQKAEAAYLQDRNQGRGQVRDQLEQQRRETDAKVKEILKEAQEQAKDQQAKMLQNVEQQLQEARGDIKAEAEKVARSLAQTVLGREVA